MWMRMRMSKRKEMWSKFLRERLTTGLMGVYSEQEVRLKEWSERGRLGKLHSFQWLLNDVLNDSFTRHYQSGRILRVKLNLHFAISFLGMWQRNWTWHGI